MGETSWHTEDIADGLRVSYSLIGNSVTKLSAKAVLELTETAAFGKMLTIDGELQSTERDEYIYHEMLVHPLASIVYPKKVKIYGGGEGATAREVLKWSSVQHVVQVDWDGVLLEHFRSVWKGWAQGAYEDHRMELRVADAWTDCAEDQEQYDYIIVDLPDPSNMEAFLELIRGVVQQLAPGGAFVINAGPIQPWDGSFAATFCKDLFEILPQAHWQHYSWHMNIPSFAAAGEWCFLGALRVVSRDDSNINSLDSRKVETPPGLRRFSERVWKYARYWPDDYPEVLASVSY